MSHLNAPSLRQLRRYAIARSLFKPTSLMRAIARLGFVQAINSEGICYMPFACACGRVGRKERG